MRKELFDEFFEILSDSFPSDEYRPHQKQLELLDRKEYGILMLPFSERYPKNAGEKGEILGAITLWDLDKFAYIEHFAVKDGYRSLGLGGKVLDEALEICNKPVWLECEKVTDEITQRRQSFYERHGFVKNDYEFLQPSYGEGRQAITLNGMTYPRKLDREEFDEYKEVLYKQVHGL